VFEVWDEFEFGGSSFAVVFTSGYPASQIFCLHSPCRRPMKSSQVISFFNSKISLLLLQAARRRVTQDSDQKGRVSIHINKIINCYDPYFPLIV